MSSACQWIFCARRSNRGVGQFVDQDEPAQCAAVDIGFEHQGAVGGHLGDTDIVEFERLGGEMLASIDRERIFGRGDRRRDGLGSKLEPVTAPGQQWLVIHPHDRRLELVGGFGRVVGRGDDIAARAIDLTRER